MKTTKIITVALLLATVVAGCSKEKSGRMRLLSESFDRNGSKVQFDPNQNPVGSTWVEGEPVKVGDGVYNIVYGLDNGGEYCYYLDGYGDVDPGDNVVETALYPGESFGGNVLSLADNEMVLSNLMIEFNGDIQNTVFPMVAAGSQTDGEHVSLYFRHLTAGLKVTLANAGADPLSIRTLKVVAWSTDNNTANLSRDGWTARWLLDSPTVPAGHVGEIDENLNVAYSSTMNFTIGDDGEPANLTLANGDSRTLCVPLTINSVRYITVSAYDASGVELFTKMADFGEPQTIQRNHMYNVGTISIN